MKTELTSKIEEKLSKATSTNRMQWVDAMRGFSMIVVVLGHVLLYMDIGGYDSFISSLFLSFRMPLFFFVSGFFSYRSNGWWSKFKVADILKRKVQAQIICTIVFFSIYQITILKTPVNFSHGFGGYWFTIVLFQMYLLYLIINYISYLVKINIFYPALIILSLCGILFAGFYNGESEINIILNWHPLGKYFQYFSFGLICAKFKNAFLELLKNKYIITISIIGWIVSLILWYNEDYKNSFPFLYTLTHDIIIRYFALLTVTILFYNLDQWISNSKNGHKLQYIGRRTLDIYMIHYFFLPDLQFLGPWLSEGNLFVVQLIISGTITLIIVGLCLLVSGILRRSDILASWLFGVKNQKSKILTS